MTGANIISVRSGDGIDLYVEQSGTGVPLLLVHGGLSTTRVFDRVRARLGASYRCLALGRRGYGQSGDGLTHSYDLEAGDVLAVLGELDQPAHVLAHSSGAIVAFTAALSGTSAIRSLVLYEPPLPIGAPAGGTWIADAEAAIARGDYEEAALNGLREAVGYPPGQVDILRADPSWPARSVLAPAWVREFRSVEALPLGTDRFALITTPTLLLLGSRSAAHAGVPTRALHDSLPHSAIATLPDQGHAALLLAPDLVCDTVLRSCPSTEAPARATGRPPPTGRSWPRRTATALFRCLVWRCALRSSFLELEHTSRWSSRRHRASSWRLTSWVHNGVS